MRKLLLLLTILSTTPALADPHDPVPGKTDPRICTFPADPNNTMRLITPGVTPVRMVFTDGSEPIAYAGQYVNEEVYGTGNTVLSKAKDWYVNGVGNTMIVQPLNGTMPTSMLFLTTKKNNEMTHYVIELRIGTGDLSAGACVEVSYTFPKTASDEADLTRAKAIKIWTENKVKTSLAQARFAVPQQRHYTKLGDDCVVMTPAHSNWVSDDGSQTNLLFPPHMDVPAFYSRTGDEDKNESLINPTATSTKAGTLITLPGVYPQIVLRKGLPEHGLVCALRADRYDPIGKQPGNGSGTISADVIRTVRAGK